MESLKGSDSVVVVDVAGNGCFRLKLISLVTVIGILSCFVDLTVAHVGLTFPPARKYDLDFLDKIRTKPPCGMPKGSLKTSFMAGSKFNVTWHLSYPHRGGYRLELMDSQERQLLDLTPKTSSEEYIKGDPTAQWHMVTLPKDFTCDDCTIRLLREASEWSGAYRFWSCADVDIVESKKYRETCMGHGRPLGGRCICNKGFSGSRCQYENECETEKECHGNGRCVNLGGTALPKKQCFCNPGFHGEKCIKRNAAKLPSHTQPLDLSRHTKRILSDRMVLYYKTIPAAKEENREIEFILLINGTSYGAIGWRPASFDRTCKRWPYIQNSTAATPGSGSGDRQGKSARLEIEVAASSERKAESEPSASEDSASEPEPHASHDGKAEPEAEAEPKSLDVEPKSVAEPDAEAEPEGEPDADAKLHSKSKPKKSKSSSSHESAASEPEPEAEAEPKSDVEPEPEAEAEAGDKKKKSGKKSKDEKKDEDAAAELEVEAGETKTEGRVASKPLPRKDSREVELSTTSSVSTSSSASSDGGKLKAKLGRKRSKLPVDDGTEVNVETSSIYVTRPKRSPEEPKPEPASEPKPEAASAEPEAESAASEPQSAAEPEGEPKSEPESESKGEPESEAEPEGTGSDGHHHHSSSHKECKLSEWTPKGDFHAMDCIDLIMGGANGVNSRIRDYYTRDRSTPRLDSFWGGKEDITSATGWEKDGETTLIFRRKVRSSDAPDHDLEGELHLIWARGQEPGEYYHKPKSGLETENPAVPQFYVPDEIKYHGHGGQRGLTRIDFLKQQQAEREANPNKKKIECGDSWSWPQTCTAIDDPTNPCDYIATWVYKPESDSVQFTIETRKANRWTGIGFSDSPSMRSTDAVLGWVTSSGQFFLMDTYITSYAAPILDRSQDISEMNGKYLDGAVTLTFNRPVKSKFDKEKDVSLDECRFFLFPVEGGTYDAVSKKIRKHEFAPISSPEKICIPTTCRPAPRPKVPTALKYTFDIKLTGGLGNNWQPPPRNSEDFAELSSRLRRDLESKFKGIPGYNSMQLTGVRKDSGEGGDGAVVAQLDLSVSPTSELADMSKVEQVLKDTIASGRAGALQVDPLYLELVRQEPIVLTSEEGAARSASYFDGHRFWIVCVCVAALILLAIVQAGLTIYKTSSKSSSHKGSPSGGAGAGAGMAWRDYSETNYGYDAYDEKQLHPNAMPLTTNPVHTNEHAQHQSQQHHQNQNQSRASQPQHSGHYEETNHGAGHHHSSKNRDGYGEGGANGAAPPSYLSLQRKSPQHQQQQQQQQQPHHRGTGGGGGVGNPNSDFYFMSSQRKYSGEVVRVFVDHNNKT